MGYTFIYKTKAFTSLVKKDALSDNDLIKACREMKDGLFETDLGSNLYKKRVSVGSKGKSGGFRTIVGAEIGDRYFFLYAFPKNKRANINPKEKVALKELAKTFVGFDQSMLKHLVATGEIIEVGDI
ncbi:MAG: type II toxin-antitoxin system RelE/ParE family toxin [Idiomarina sp.]